MVCLTLAAAIASEIVATTLMKHSDGSSRLWPSVGTVTGHLVAFVGMLFLGEVASVAKVLGVALVVAGVVTLNLGGAH